jgi:hypothetical protein
MLGIVPARLQAETGRYAADALTLIGPGTRAQGLGGAFAGLADDASAVYWNPAGLPQIRKNQVLFNHLSLFGGLAAYDFVSLALPLPNKAAGALSWTRVGVDDIPEYAELKGTPEERRYSPQYRSTGEPFGYFNSQEMQVVGTFAKMLTINYFNEQIELLPEPVKLYLGLSMKWYRQVMYGFTGTASALDAGALCNIGLNWSLFGEAPRRDLGIGLAFQNLLATDLAWNTPGEASDQVPTVTRFGLAYSEYFARLLSTLTLAYEGDRDYVTSSHYGAEYRFKELLYVRGGYTKPAWTAGAGVHVRGFLVGYAFNNHPLEPLHSVSLGYEF